MKLEICCYSSKCLNRHLLIKHFVYYLFIYCQNFDLEAGVVMFIGFLNFLIALGSDFLALTVGITT